MTFSYNMEMKCTDVLGTIILAMLNLNVIERLRMRIVLQDIKRLY